MQKESKKLARNEEVDTKPLKGIDGYRLRVVKIGSRGDIYK